MEENKNCCNGGECKNMNSCCGCMCFKKYFLLKMFVVVVLLVAAFCMGSMVGRSGDWGKFDGPRYMMKDGFGPKGYTPTTETSNPNVKTGSASVQIGGGTTQ